MNRASSPKTRAALVLLTAGFCGGLLACQQLCHERGPLAMPASAAEDWSIPPDELSPAGVAPLTSSLSHPPSTFTPIPPASTQPSMLPAVTRQASRVAPNPSGEIEPVQYLVPAEQSPFAETPIHYYEDDSPAVNLHISSSSSATPSSGESLATISSSPAHAVVQSSLIQPPPPPPSESTPGFDSRVVARGRNAFEMSCTDCHDAERSTSKRKSLSAWLATVQRMAAKDGAAVDAGDIRSIATYLASLNPAATDGGLASDVTPSTWSFSATISPVWRGGNDAIANSGLENPGFFPDVWVTASYQGSSPLSATVTACTSCHGDNSQTRAFTLEMVEASATLDLIHWLRGCPASCGFSARVKAGRFIVPFGAIAQRSHPGAMRMVTLPLMYNMGRRVGPISPFQPVLPAPYADEGVDLQVKTPLVLGLDTSFDIYAVNGLQEGGPTIFRASREYVDNNSHTSVGVRGTVGNDWFRLGGSSRWGRLDNDGSPPQRYSISGADLQFDLTDDVSFWLEYAIRSDDFANMRNHVYGLVAEGEVLVLEHPGISLMARYDTLDHRGVFGSRSVERFTWGAGIRIAHSSELLINHEHWENPGAEPDFDLVGFRWTAVF